MRGIIEQTVVTDELKRYFLVAITAFTVDYSILYLITEWFGINYLISAAISFIFAAFVSYSLCVTFVFMARSIERKRLEFTIFIIIGIVGLFLNEILMWLQVDRFSINYMVSKLPSTAIVFFWNFLARKYLLFR